MTAADSAGAGADPGGPGDRLLSWGKVRDITGLSRTTLWRRQKVGDFPLPVQISPGRVGWWESELARWKASRAPRAASASLSSRASARVVAPPPEPVAAPDLPCPAPPSPCLLQGSGAPARRRSQAPCERQISFDF